MDGIDASTLAEKLVPMLLPLLPYLVKGVKIVGENFLKALGDKSGGKAVEVAEKVWKKIQPNVDQEPDLKQLILVAADDPTKNFLPGALTYQFQNLFLKNERIQSDICAIVAESEKAGVTLKSFIEAGEVYGEVTGIKVVNLSALIDAGLISSEIKANLIAKGGKITGFELK